MKKVNALIMAGIMALFIAACGTQKTEEKPIGGEPNTWGPSLEEEGYMENTEDVQIPAPFKEYDSMEEASKAVGFNLVAPDDITGYTEKFITVYDMDANMIQVMYSNNEASITIRKEVFREEGKADISGVYIDYSENTSADENGISYELKGENQLVHVVNWADGDNNYSIFSDAGMDKEAALKLATQVQ